MADAQDRVVDPTRRRPAGPGEAGFALILALVVLLLVSAALSLIAAALHLRLRELDRRTTELRLVALADEALAETLAHLAQSSGFAGLPRRAIPGGWLESEVRSLTSERVRVEIQVHYRGAKRAVQADVRLREDDPPQLLAWSSRTAGGDD